MALGQPEQSRIEIGAWLSTGQVVVWKRSVSLLLCAAVAGLLKHGYTLHRNVGADATGVKSPPGLRPPVSPTSRSLQS
jgi:hypothetical protein